MPQAPDSSYLARRWLWYYREVPEEAEVPFDLPVLFRDEYLVVVDKPHFLASTPGGRYLRETALTRLRQVLELPLLSPVHRLDRSEEHTSELQSLLRISYAVFCLKKKKK